MMGKKMTITKTQKTILLLTIFLLLFASTVTAATITLTLGSYDDEIYKQSSINIPVTVKTTNITGSVSVVLTPKSGLSCDTCTLTPSFNGGTNEQKTVTFTLTGTQTGSYNPPFISISAQSGSTTATPISNGNAVSVVEKPTWTKNFDASETNININNLVTLTLDIIPSGGSFEGVIADLSLPTGISLVSGQLSKNIGIISGQSSYQWVVKATNAGSKNIEISLTATNPQESSSLNTESITLIVTDPDPVITPAGGDSPAGSDSPSGAGGGSDEILNYGNLTDYGIKTISNEKYSFREVELKIDGLVENAKLFVSKKSSVDDTYPIVEGEVYQYVLLSSSNIESVLELGTVKFRVEKDWVDDIDSDLTRIFLLRYNGNNWIQEPVVYTTSDSDYYYYKATFDNLGMFAVAALPEIELDYVKMSDLVPEKIDLEMVIESGLSDAIMIDRLESYLFGKLNLEKTIQASKNYLTDLGIKREVESDGNVSRMIVTITNNKAEAASFMLVEAVPKSIVHDIYELYNFDPRIYDLIIREDPVIQWSFGEADTAIVAWEIKNLGAGDTARFSYSLDAVFEIDKYPAPIIIKPIVETGLAQAAGDDELSSAVNSSKLKALSIILVIAAIMSIIGVVFSMKTKSTVSSENHDDKKLHGIVEYIKKGEKKGMTHAELKNKLIKVGWDVDTIEKAFKKNK